MRAVVHVETDLSLLESLAAGVQALECGLSTGAGAAWLSLDACRALRASVETSGLRIDVASADLSGQVPPAREGALEEWLKAHLSSALERSVCLGATTLALTTLRAGDPEITAGAVPYALALNAVYRSLMSVRAAAERAGITVALGAAQHRFLLSPCECRDLVDEINAPNVGILLDAAAVSSIGDPTDWIGTLGQRVAAVRITSRAVGPARNLLAALESMHFDGPVVFNSAADAQSMLSEAGSPRMGNAHTKSELGNPGHDDAASRAGRKPLTPGTPNPSVKGRSEIAR